MLLGPADQADAGPVALGAGHGIVAFLLREPCLHGIVILQEQSLGESGTCAAHPSRGEASGLVYAAGGGVAWWLGLRDRTVIAEDISGGNRLVARLGAKGVVSAACSSDGATIAYTDAARPGWVLFQRLDRPDTALPAPAADSLGELEAAEWPMARLGGSPGQPCVLVTPHSNRFAVIGVDGTVRTAPFHEAVPGAHSVTGALDATSIPGGVAVLFHGTTPLAGRWIDLYDAQGAYRESILLPHRAARIAATGSQLLVLSHRERAWFLSAFRIPGVAGPVGPAGAADSAIPVHPLR